MYDYNVSCGVYHNLFAQSTDRNFQFLIIINSVPMSILLCLLWIYECISIKYIHRSMYMCIFIFNRYFAKQFPKVLLPIYSPIKTLIIEIS